MSTYLLEIGTEELPAKFANSAISQFKEFLEFEFEKNYIKYDEIIVTSTPRRLIVYLEGVVDFGEPRTSLIKGPKASVAFSDGSPSKAALGFAKSLDINVEDLQINKTKKGEFVFGKKFEKSKSSKELISVIVPKAIKALQGERFMKWSFGDFRFSRPIRWIISLYNNDLLNMDLRYIDRNLKVSNVSRGHRLFKNYFEINNSKDYFQLIEKYGVIANREIRKKYIIKLINDSSKELNLLPDLNDSLINELTDLVEFPDLVIGNFDKKYLSLPPELICSVMKSHQRYIPLLNKDAKLNKLSINSYGILSTKFICISNGLNKSNNLIKEGNEKVLKARFADAKFFIEADIKNSCKTRNQKIKNINYLKGLGNVFDSVNRISYIASEIFRILNDNSLSIEIVIQASKFLKHDLCSEIVFEFPELQGIMGGKYLSNEGFCEDVSLAVSEQYLPRFSEDHLPSNKYGAIIAISEKLETLISIYAIGKRPSGSSDPFALRRNMNGIIQIIWHFELNIKLDKLVDNLCIYWKNSIEEFPFDFEQVSRDLIVFLKQRILSHLEELNLENDLIKSVSESDIYEEKLFNLFGLKKRIDFLDSIRNEEGFEDIRTIISRISKLANKGDLGKEIYFSDGIIDKKLFEKRCEERVFELIKQFEDIVRSNDIDFLKIMRLFKENVDTLKDIFDIEEGVLIMSEDINIKNNRLKLLGLIRNYSLILADFTLFNS